MKVHYFVGVYYAPDGSGLTACGRMEVNTTPDARYATCRSCRKVATKRRSR